MLSSILPNLHERSLFKISRKLQNKVFSGQLSDFSFFEALFAFRVGFVFSFIFRAVYILETHFLLLLNAAGSFSLNRLSFLFNACLVRHVGSSSFFYILNAFNSSYSRALLFSRMVVQAWHNMHKQLNFWFTAINFGYSCSLFLIGLGFKLFFYNNAFFIKLGYCKIIQFPVPATVHVFSKKRNKFRLFAQDPSALGNFISTFLKLRLFNFYKGKGIYFLPTFGAIKLKKGKQQQF